MKINCTSCGHKVDLGNDYDDFTGEVKCFVCGALLEVKTEEGNVKAVKLVKIESHPSPEEGFVQAR